MVNIDAASECRSYEDKITAAGGIDSDPGIGTNGHIGFNEPGAPFAAPLVLLTQLWPLSRLIAVFAKPEDVPRQATPMGIKSIMNSRKIVLLANGESKGCYSEGCRGPVTEGLGIGPVASRLYLYIDQQAAKS